MIPPRETVAPTDVERFAFSATRRRWLEFLTLEHSTLPLPLDFEREGEDFLVRRARPAGRRIGAGRVPRGHGASLFLQVAAALAFFQSAGFWLDEEDLREAVWDTWDGSARLWLTRTPASVARSGPGPAPSAVLAGLLHRIFAGGRRIGNPAARGLFDRLLDTDAPFRRAEYWLASAFRVFPELAGVRSAGTRVRTMGSAGSYFRSAHARALVAKARAILSHRTARVFESRGSTLTAGGALPLDGSEVLVRQAVQRLRELHAREASGRGTVWIAVEPEGWDAFSRQAFDAASCALQGEIETVAIVSDPSVPGLPDEWRREIFVPCGTIPAALKFYERLAAEARTDPPSARRMAEECVGSTDWAGFVGDPTGDAPLPFPLPTASAAGRCEPEEIPAKERGLMEVLSALHFSVSGPELATRLSLRSDVSKQLARLEARGFTERDTAGRWRLSPSGHRRVQVSPRAGREICRRFSESEPDPGRRVELLLAAGEKEQALEEAERWFRSSLGETAGSVEKWFGLSAALVAASGDRRPAWLEALEAERELSGGRAEEAEMRLLRVSEAADATLEERRAAILRSAEVCVLRGQIRPAARRAAAWRQAFPDASLGDRARALRIEARGRAREGRYSEALGLLDEAERVGARLSPAERLETALGRAAVYSLAGRFREEQELYDQWRGIVLREGEDLLTARLLSREALGLSDRRDFASAVARLKEALAVVRDDVGERARILFDLSATLYHAGRPDECVPLLEEAMTLAALAGRKDLVRGARGNRVELWINRGAWEAAAAEVEALLASAEQEGDDTWRLVALHHRSRLALRQGRLEAAARDNAEARGLAKRLSDRLEIGELWLEEGDRCAYSGDVEGARRAYELAAEDPPDRCDSDVRARERLRELAWREGPPNSAQEELSGLFARDDYAAAETVARWRAIHADAAALSPELLRRAESILRARGGAALADHVFGPGETAPAAAAEPLRALRAVVAQALIGEARETPAEVDETLGALGLVGLAIADSQERELTLLGRPGDRSGTIRRRLEAGAASYELSLWPSEGKPQTEPVALVLETLLFRALPPAAPSEFAEGWRRFGIVAADSSLEEPYRRLVRFSPQPVTVLVLGESGSGKEAVARAVHALSPRASGPFVAVNISAIPPALLESELFGHTRGAFTGADRDRRGLLEEAAGGTIFFDEIGDLSLSLQSKLLRALQEGEIRRVGENRPRGLDARVVSATSRPLAREVEEGRFREDLFYRLYVAVISLPPLRDRGRDAALLARHFLTRYGREYGRGDLQFSPEAVALLTAHSWPGNVRELQNVVAQAAALAEPNGVISSALLPDSMRRERSRPATENYRSRLDAHRRGLITEALEQAGGNRSRAARNLGLSRQALLYLIRELQIPPRSRVSH